MVSEVLILSGARTAIGDFGGALKEVSAADLGAAAIRAAIARAAIGVDGIQNVVMGNVIPSRPEDAYIARVCAVAAGIPVGAPALTVNRLCGSGLQAIISAAQGVALGEYEIAVAGGTECMSQAPFYATSLRFGQRLGDATMLDALTRTLSDPFDGFHMGITAENVAAKFDISRQTQDEAAVESHRRAAVAIAEGRFASQIVPIELKTRKGITVFDTDEHVRADASVEGMAQLRAAFRKDGTVTAGNSSGINDGAAAVVLASREVAEREGLKPMARILGWGIAGVQPTLMGLGPINAVPIALRRAGLLLDEIDVIESNEAFAAQSCAVALELGLDPLKTNINGSGISLGHPVGATGAILTVKAMYELVRSEGRYALITMCIGGGQGIALVIERV